MAQRIHLELRKDLKKTTEDPNPNDAKSELVLIEFALQDITLD